MVQSPPITLTINQVTQTSLNLLGIKHTAGDLLYQLLKRINSALEPPTSVTKTKFNVEAYKLLSTLGLGIRKSDLNPGERFNRLILLVSTLVLERSTNKTPTDHPEKMTKELELKQLNSQLDEALSNLKDRFLSVEGARKARSRLNERMKDQTEKLREELNALTCNLSIEDLRKEVSQLEKEISLVSISDMESIINNLRFVEEIQLSSYVPMTVHVEDLSFGDPLLETRLREAGIRLYDNGVLRLEAVVMAVSMNEYIDQFA